MPVNFPGLAAEYGDGGRVDDYGTLGGAGAIVANDFLTLDGATGFIRASAADDIPFAVARDDNTPGAVSGDTSVAAFTSRTALFRYTVSAGAITPLILGKSYNLGGAQSVNLTLQTFLAVRVIQIDVALGFVYVELL